MPTTTNFGWTIPTLNGDPGIWDTILNDAFEEVDTDVKAIQTTANAAMPKAGGVFTGAVELKTVTAGIVDKGAMSGAVTLDLSTANFFHGTKTGAVTFTFSNWVASKAHFFLVEIDNTAAGSITWPGAVQWDQDTAPTIDSADTQTFVFWSRDGGTTIRGKLVHQAAS